LGGVSGGSSAQSQEATKFEVRIRINEAEGFRPGMSVSCEIESRYRTNVLTVPIASVTTRMPNLTNQLATASSTNVTSATATNSSPKADSIGKDALRPIEVVFVVDGDKVKQVPVKIGISDEAYWEIIEGLKDGDEIVSGGFQAIGRDLQDGKLIKKNTPEAGSTSTVPQT
jgi:HlyD family secretion protein